MSPQFAVSFALTNPDKKGNLNTCVCGHPGKDHGERQGFDDADICPLRLYMYKNHLNTTWHFFNSSNQMNTFSILSDLLMPTRNAKYRKLACQLPLVSVDYCWTYTVQWSSMTLQLTPIPVASVFSITNSCHSTLWGHALSMLLSSYSQNWCSSIIAIRLNPTSTDFGPSLIWKHFGTTQDPALEQAWPRVISSSRSLPSPMARTK